MDLVGRTALVTGGAVRIGAAICRYLAVEGCNVVIHYDRSAAEAERLSGELKEAGVNSWAMQCHFSGGKADSEFLNAVLIETGGISVLINNAAVFRKDRLVDVTEDDLLGELNTNLLSPILLTRRFAQLLSNDDPDHGSEDAADRPGKVVGKVVNILDRRIATNESGCIPYLLSKKALADFTRSAALELAPAVTVNGVAPGAILPPPGSGDDYLYDAAGDVPLECNCTPGDVAGAVGFLLKSDFVTGQVVFVDGGQHLAG
jgi:NAD(P)-dependent dehydrogenase (short-subunit alcohol dehydrogenase family)